jgi:uncharacterized membrane protein
MTAPRHPLHPALVHFPIACWSLAAAADLAGLWWGEAAWRWSAGLLATGCTLALAAMLAGLWDITRVPEGPALRAAHAHMAAMLLAFGAFCTRLLLRLDHLQPLPPNAASLLLDAAGMAALLLGGWLGAQLVYRHGVGTALLSPSAKEHP